MRGPYHPDLYDVARWPESWWRASAPPPPPRPPLEGDATAEVAIIGAGYAGLACAEALAGRGVDVVALDAGEIGWGASGRNGGIVGLSSDKLGTEALVARFGEDETRRYVESQVEGARRLRAFCDAEGVETQGDAEAYVAHTPAVFERLGKWREARWGVEASLLSREAYAERGYVGPEQHGALIVRPGFGLHPMQLAQARARAAERAGARLHPRSEVRAWRREGATHRLETARGSIRAGKVVLATNGFTPDGLHPAFDGRAMPVLSMIGVTRQINQAEMAAHGWREDAPLCTTRRMLYYFRMLPQRRLLFGMRGDLDGSAASAPRFAAHLRAHMARMLPEWRDVELEHFWRGPVCMTRAYRPAVGRLPDDPTVFHAFGWHGSGVNGAAVAGRLLAAVIAGADEATIPAPWRGLPPRIPLPGLRKVWLGGMLALYRAKDAMEAR
ncbi:MAG: FAD-binding oxidoreductase [Rhodobacteraceae bacterium]|nr:MAG: FAD-binding oxidoreductase [Paracoccaceae bacterium]